MAKKKKHALTAAVKQATTEVLTRPHFHMGKAANFGRDVGAILGLDCTSVIDGDQVHLTVRSPDHSDFKQSYFWTEPTVASSDTNEEEDTV